MTLYAVLWPVVELTLKKDDALNVIQSMASKHRHAPVAILLVLLYLGGTFDDHSSQQRYL